MWHIISDYYLENTPESVSEHLFSGGACPQTPLAAPCFACSVVYYTCTHTFSDPSTLPTILLKSC